jgi:hypothetical protein
MLQLEKTRLAPTHRRGRILRVFLALPLTEGVGARPSLCGMLPNPVVRDMPGAGVSLLAPPAVRA